MNSFKIFSGLILLLLGSMLAAQTVVKMDMPPQADEALQVVALFDEELPEGVPVVLGLMGYDFSGGMAPFNFEWMLNGEVISTNDIAIFTPHTGDDLVLKITDNNACSASTAFNLKISSIPKPEDEGLENIRIYPTMVKDEIFIELPQSDVSISQVRIFDVTGKLVFEQDLQGSTRIFPGLDSGIFFVSVRMNEKHKVEKVTAF